MEHRPENLNLDRKQARRVADIEDDLHQEVTDQPGHEPTIQGLAS